MTLPIPIATVATGVVRGSNCHGCSAAAQEEEEEGGSCGGGGGGVGMVLLQSSREFMMLVAVQLADWLHQVRLSACVC